MRETHSHLIFRTLIANCWQQTRLRCIHGQLITSPLDCIKDVFYEFTADVKALRV